MHAITVATPDSWRPCGGQSLHTNVLHTTDPCTQQICRHYFPDFAAAYWSAAVWLQCNIYSSNDVIDL